MPRPWPTFLSASKLCTAARFFLCLASTLPWLTLEDRAQMRISWVEMLRLIYASNRV